MNAEATRLCEAVRAMIVDCAYYKDRKRQHEDPIDLDRALECLRSDQGFIWLGMLAYVFLLWRRLASVDRELAALRRSIEHHD